MKFRQNKIFVSFQLYFFIISVMIKRNYSERDGTFIRRELKKLPKQATLVYIIVNINTVVTRTQTLDLGVCARSRRTDRWSGYSCIYAVYQLTTVRLSCYKHHTLRLARLQVTTTVSY